MKTIQNIAKYVVLALSLSSLLGLSACFNDTPYSSGYSHIGIIEFDGPGYVVFESELTGPKTCTEADNRCAHVRSVLEKSSVIFTAVPDEGHTFVGWSGDITGNENPLILTVEGRDYFFEAVFE
jgi:hypothetical protein